MKDKLTYSVQRCVLEHFEANKRFRFSSRCPSIKSIENSIPLRIRYLSFANQTIQINNISYKFEDRTVKVRETTHQKISRQTLNLEPGIPIAFDLAPTYYSYLRLKFENKSNSVIEFKNLPMKFTELSFVMKNFTEIWLKGRLDIKVNILDFNLGSQKFLRIPEKQIYHTRRINIYRNDLALIQAVIDSKCLPLKSIFITSWRESYYKNQMILNSEELILESTENETIGFWLPVILSVPNKKVVMRGLEFSETEIQEIIGNLKEKGKAIESSFILECSGNKFLSKLLENIEKMFDGKEVTLKEGIGNLTIVSKIISIPLNPESELVVYGYTKNWETDNKVRILLKVFASGNTNAVKKRVMGFRIPWIFEK